VIAELNAITQATTGASDPAADAVAWGTCEHASFGKEMAAVNIKFITQVLECIELGEGRCSSKPYCVKSKPAGATETVCVADIQEVRSKQFRALVDANPTPYSKRLGSIMDQCDEIKSAQACNEALLLSPEPGTNTNGTTLPTVVPTSGAAGSMGGVLAACLAALVALLV
jgi:hypothetical protein